MPSKKLHLKRTPAEQAEHEWRKAQRAARKAAKKQLPDDDDDAAPSRSPKRRRTDVAHDARYDSDSEYGPPPPPDPSSTRAHKPDYDAIRAELEEARFREKMWGAFEDDERLDAVESRMNSFAHVPRRWRGGGMERMDDELGVDPHMMEEEDYAEWIRAGMWRKQHKEEHEERVRQEAERAARLKREKALKEETTRMERAAEDERRKKRRVKEHRREAEAREVYDLQWKELLTSAGEDKDRERLLRFADIPWPVMPGDAAISLEDLTVLAISAFLSPPDRDDTELVKKERKDKLRETMLRFHPDKFEGRIMSRVREVDREQVREAVGMVVRAVSSLMGGD
ncbi:hypothetical protein B0H21DRAFT_145831 [Amylocystis lapponica]|nr:hypothetical protein B0H21DRAFT_145831 [Amylocystis lapponica]